MKLLSRQELTSQLASQKQVSLDRLAFIEDQVQLKLDEYNLLDSQFEAKKAQITIDFDAVLADLTLKKGSLLSEIARLEEKKKSIEQSVENLLLNDREQSIASKELDLNGKEADLERRNFLLEEKSKKSSVENAKFLQLVAELEGKKSFLNEYESKLNGRTTALQDDRDIFEEEKEALRKSYEIKEKSISDREELVRVLEDTNEKIKLSLEDSQKELENNIVHFRSQQITTEALYLDLKKKGLI